MEEEKGEGGERWDVDGRVCKGRGGIEGSL